MTHNRDGGGSDNEGRNSSDSSGSDNSGADLSCPAPLPTAPPPPPLPPLFSTRPRLDYVSHPPDFGHLARLYPAFAAFVRFRVSGERRRATVDFRDPRAILALTATLLAHDFQLRCELPIAHLCPPLPQRLAVLYWVADLIAEQRQQGGSSAVPRRGLDVGCGASAIFPLLGARGFGWQFLATEVDEPAIAAARHNVALNGLGGAVEVRAVADRRQLLVGVVEAADAHFDFLVCNPPFFSSLAEAQLSPDRATVGTLSELCCEGGELSFVRSLYADSARLRRQVDWCVCMIGKKDTLRVLRAELAGLQQQQQQQSSGVGQQRRTVPCQVRTMTFVQGKQTRWGIAWTFNAMLPQPQSQSRSSASGT